MSPLLTRPKCGAMQHYLALVRLLGSPKCVLGQRRNGSEDIRSLVSSQVIDTLPDSSVELGQSGGSMSKSNQSGTSHLDQEGARLLLNQQQFGRAAQAYASSPIHSQGPDLKWIVEEAVLSGQELVVDVATGTG